MPQSTAGAVQHLSASAARLSCMLHRSHWLLALQLEWEASRSCSDEDGFEKLGQARHHRCRVEAMHDEACKETFQKRCEFHMYVSQASHGVNLQSGQIS